MKYVGDISENIWNKIKQKSIIIQGQTYDVKTTSVSVFKIFFNNL